MWVIKLALESVNVKEFESVTSLAVLWELVLEVLMESLLDC